MVRLVSMPAVLVTRTYLELRDPGRLLPVGTAVVIVGVGAYLSLRALTQI